MQRFSSGVTKPRKGSVLVIYRTLTYTAFKSDIELFLETYEKENSFNYTNFANIWQSMNFSFIFADQSNLKILTILCEICFTVVKKYIMFQSSLHIQIGAFYLLYGLYYKQPIQCLFKVRLTLEEYRKIKDLMDEMLNKGQYDALYIFAKMTSDEAFVYVAHPKPLSVLTKPSVTRIEVDDTFKSRGSESSIYKFEEILQDETVQALHKTCTEYEAKMARFAKQNRGLTLFKTTIIHDLEEAHGKIFVKKCTASDEVKPETNIIQNLRESIRLKALGNKHAQYRGLRKVVTAVDLDEDTESD